MKRHTTLKEFFKFYIKKNHNILVKLEAIKSYSIDTEFQDYPFIRQEDWSKVLFKYGEWAIDELSIELIPYGGLSVFIAIKEV